MFVKLKVKIIPDQNIKEVYPGSKLLTL